MSGEKGNGAQGRVAGSDALVIENLVFFGSADNNVRQYGMAATASRIRTGWESPVPRKGLDRPRRTC
jgi:hypothetical protein